MDTFLAPRPAARLRRAGFPATRPARAAVADLLAGAAWFSVVIVVALFLADGGAQGLDGLDATATAVGRLAGLVATDLLLVQMLLVARIPWVDRTVGHDRATAQHRRLGKPILYLVLLHVAAILVGYGALDGIDVPGRVWSILTSVPDMLTAVAALGGLVAVVGTSIVVVRRRLPYEAWYAVHLLAYASVALAIPHQLSTGTTLATSPIARAYWIALYAAAAGGIVVFRFVGPLVRTLHHPLVVSGVRAEAPGIVSVEMTGPAAARLPGEGGQYFFWRFWAPGLWWQSHPYSLSAAPDGRRLRITVRALGGGSAALARLRPGTRVTVAGPYGRLTRGRLHAPRAVLVASGIGITPIRALLEELPAGPNTVVYRASREQDVVFRDELLELCRQRGAELFLLTGPRPASGHGWGPAQHPGLRLVDVAPLVRHSDVVICGPVPWARLVEADARRSGVRRDRLHIEEFAW